MEVKKFTRELKRMCNFYYDEEKGYCSDDCPAQNLDCMSLDQPESDIERVVEVVEAWSAAHSRKTRLDVFLEQHPEATLNALGVIPICPLKLIKNHENSRRMCETPGNTCDDCMQKFWSEEVD